MWALFLFIIPVISGATLEIFFFVWAVLNTCFLLDSFSLLVYIFKVIVRSGWHYLSVLWWFLKLFDFEVLLAGWNMQWQTLGPELKLTDIAFLSFRWTVNFVCHLSWLPFLYNQILFVPNALDIVLFHFTSSSHNWILFGLGWHSTRQCSLIII
mgnify:FL=1